MRRHTAATLLTCSTLVASAVMMTTGSPTAQARSACGNWTKATVASGFGMLEDLAFDGRGNLLLSDQSATGVDGAIRQLRANGTRRTVTKVNGPGALLVSSGKIYFTAGLSMMNSLGDKATGAIKAIDPNSGAITTVASGLRLPNGLAKLPNGDFVFTADMGSAQHVSRVRNGAYAGPFDARITSTNGLAYDAKRKQLFVSTTFSRETTIARYDIDRPGSRPRLYTLPGFGPLNGADDLTIAPDGSVYVAVNIGGRVVRLNPGTGAFCTIADGMPLTTSVEFGAGPGWNPRALYATSYLGTVTRLTRN